MAPRRVAMFVAETERLVLFCRALRDRGLAVTPAEAVTAVTAFGLIDSSDRDEVFLTLRSILTVRVDDFPVFAELFDQFWNRLPQKRVEREPSFNAKPQTRRPLPKQTSKGIAFLLQNWTAPHDADGEQCETPGASDVDTRKTKDLTSIEGEELEQITRLARRIVKRLARNPSRRWKPVRTGQRVNLRRSFRQSLKTGGEIIELSYRQRKPKRTKLIVICDVSGSMDIYSRFLLQFVYGVQNSFAKVETFVFSTALSQITQHVKNKTYHRALERLSSSISGWSGGTRIGASLAAFNAEWLRRIDRRTIVIILSDGWDTGEPEQLAAALSLLKQRAGRLIWLNPLLGNSNYEPLTRGMQAALPFIDVFAPAHNLASLRALEPHLVL